MCYYHPASLFYAPPNPYQHFVRPCNQAKYHPTTLAYPTSSSTSGGATGASDSPAIQTTHGILVTPCSNHCIADETGGDSGTGERVQSEECRLDESRENMQNMDDGDGNGDGDGMECDPFDSDSDSDSDDDDDADAGWSAEDDDNDEDEENTEHNTNTELAVPVHTKAIKPRSSPSPILSTNQPKPQPKRFRRELLSGPVQHLRMKWKKALVNRSLQKSAAAAASASQAEPRRLFNNGGFVSWASPEPGPVYQLGNGTGFWYYRGS